MHDALKEWAAVVDAVGAGDQIVLVRKGGIDEKRFEPPATRFFLFPTQFHQGENDFKPQFASRIAASRTRVVESSVPIEYWCELTDVHRVDDLERLLALDPFVIFTEATIRARYAFRPRQAMHVLVLRAHRLESARTIEVTPDLLGCRSWVQLDGAIDVAGSVPVLDDEEFRRRRDLIESAIG